jgi:hypothetical protein
MTKQTFSNGMSVSAAKEEARQANEDLVRQFKEAGGEITQCATTKAANKLRLEKAKKPDVIHKPFSPQAEAVEQRKLAARKEKFLNEQHPARNASMEQSMLATKADDVPWETE